MFPFNTCRALHCIFYAVIGQFLVLIRSAVSCISFTLAVPGQEVTSPLATILSQESPATSQPQANQLSQNNEDVLMKVDQFTQNYELESGHSFRVKGNLKNNLVFWRSIGAPDFILSIIENGYRLTFISFWAAVKLRNSKSARIHVDFVDQAVLELLN